MIRSIIGLIGRALLCAIFVVSALMVIIPHFETTVERMTATGIPEAKLVLMGAIVFMLLGSLLVIIGVGSRFGAILLLVFIAAATYFFHDFWNIDATQQVVAGAADISGADARMNEMVHFMKNVAIAGGLLTIVGKRPRNRDELDDGYLD